MAAEFIVSMVWFMPFARLVVDLLLLRRGPQDMPAGKNMLYGSAVAYCIFLFLQIRIIAPFGSSLFQSVVSTIALGVYALLLLKWRRFPERIPQTLVTLFAVGAVFSVLNLGPTAAMAPFIHALGHATTPAAIPQPSPVAALAGAAIALWSLTVFAHVYRNALGCRFWQGLAAAFGFEIFLFVLFSLLGGF